MKTLSLFLLCVLSVGCASAPQVHANTSDDDYKPKTEAEAVKYINYRKMKFGYDETVCMNPSAKNECDKVITYESLPHEVGPLCEGYFESAEKSGEIVSDYTCDGNIWLDSITMEAQPIWNSNKCDEECMKIGAYIYGQWDCPAGYEKHQIYGFNPYGERIKLYRPLKADCDRTFTYGVIRKEKKK